MNDEIVLAKKSELELYYNDVCQDYGVSCKIISKNKYPFSKTKENFLVLGVNGVPADLNVKDIFIRNERTNALFYTDYFVVKIDDEASNLEVVQDAVSYCKTVEFLKKLFNEFQAPLPKVLRGSEIGALKEYNSGRNNKALSPEGRSDFHQGLKKYFKKEKSRNKFVQKWRAFVRSDKYDRKASQLKMFVDFLNRDKQFTTVDLLHETNDDLKTALINEHEYVRFKEIMQKNHPEILYHVSDIEVHNTGFDVKRNKKKPIQKIKSGPFGKLVTYEAFCKELESRFASEGYEAIKDLNPSYYETRQLTYKEIDEPYIASVLNSIRFDYAKSDSLETVRVPGIDIVSYLDVPVLDMMNFVSLAKANDVPFYLDFSGKFGTPNLEKVRVVYGAGDDDMMNGIVSRMINEKFELSHINTSLKAPPLDKKINQARHVSIKSSERIDLCPER